MAIHTTISYCRVGYLLHLMTVVEIYLLWRLYSFPFLDWTVQNRFLLRFIFFLPLLCLPVFAQLDARSRFQNYKLIKDHLYLYGFQPRIIKLFMKSRCQRDAAMTAAAELGFRRQCKNIFNDNGYHWYHLFPDVTFNRPQILLTKNFWMTTLFTKTYHSKIDFSKMKLNAKKDPKNILVLS